MDRFTKIVLEQIKRGDFGAKSASEKTLKYLRREDGGVTAFEFIVNLKRGQKFGPYNIATRGISTTRWNKYNTKEYIYVIGFKGEGSKKRIDAYPIWIIKLNENPINQLDNNMIQDNSLGKVGNKTDGAYAFDFVQYKKLLDLGKKQKQKADDEKRASADKAKQKIANIKAEKELLYKFGMKHNFGKGKKAELKSFVKLEKNKYSGEDYGWDSSMEPARDFIRYMLAGNNWGPDEKPLTTYKEILKYIKDNLNESRIRSTNYFKGTGLNIKLKDLLQECLIKEQMPGNFDTARAQAAVEPEETLDVTPTPTPDVTPTSNKKKPVVNTKKTPKDTTTPEEKSDACSEINKYKNQYYKSNTEISGPRAVTYDIWELYTSAAKAIRSHFKDEAFWVDFKGTNFPILGGDNERAAVNWYWGDYFASPGGRFYDLVYKPYILKAVRLTEKYSKAARECGDDHDRSFFDLFGTSDKPHGRNYMILRQAWIDGRKKTYGDTSNDTLIIKLESPTGVSTYTIDTDF